VILCASVSLGFGREALAASDRDDPVTTALLSPATGDVSHEPTLPTPLSPADAARYGRIFRLQEKAQWQAADAEIAAVDDRILVGSVLAQRYLSTTYRTGFAEARDWLTKYADQPEARLIADLAARRRVGGGALAKPEPGAPLRGSMPADPADLHPIAVMNDKAGSDKVAEALKAKIRTATRTDPTEAAALLLREETVQSIDEAELDALRVDVAEALRHQGRDADALMLAGKAKSKAYQPIAHWQAGLAAWRLRHFSEAGMHFEALARSPNMSNWNVAAGAFWAARAYLVTKRPQMVNYWLGIAADQPRTFYGLIARRMLGLEPDFSFAAATLDAPNIATLNKLPGGRRAMALLQIGETHRAEAELRAVAGKSTPGFARAVVALADLANMPSLSLQLGSALTQVDGRRHDDALYPVPRWQPTTGFSVDRALLFALMMQESLFDIEARSGSGAAGLMQLMPGTARAMATRIGLKIRSTDELDDPVLNLTLGQEYVRNLVDHDFVRGNLVLLIAAYNSGPQPIPQWQNQADTPNDPFMFIESMPRQETRLFVERVLTNLWIYRQRLNQATPELDKLAAGKWPTYVALDDSAQGTTRYAAAR